MFINLFSTGFVKILRVNSVFFSETSVKCRWHRFHTNFSLNTNVNNGPDSNEEDGVSEPYDTLVERRRQQAKHSIIVQVQSKNSSSQLHEYCSQFGEITSMHHYNGSNSTMHFILVEFGKAEVLTEVMKACGHHERNEIIPTYSRMLWFRNNQKKKMTTQNTSVNFPLTSGAPIPVRQEILEWLATTDNISDQIQLLYRTTRLDDIGTRLRYVTAQQLEIAVSGLFPRARVLLFGSSVNGLGRQGCDLDLVLQLDHQTEQDDAKCRLMFHAKPSMNPRSQTQRHIDGLGDLIQWFLPGCNDVRRILQARVPIVKFRQELTNIDCDLSLTNMTAVYMSEMLYMFGAADWRFRPLVFTVRRWAAEVGLTNPSPGRWITNFSLTLLVVFYLQQVKVLPPLDFLRQKARKSDHRVADSVSCTFLRDVSKLSPSNNKATLESLLIGFLEYYASFDFYTDGIALGPGAPTKKRDHSALYITNPLEAHLNVSQNVSLEETERLKIEFRNAAWELQNCTEKDNSKEWGLLRLYKENKLIDKARQFEMNFTQRKKPARLVPIHSLFEDEESESTSNKNKSAETFEKTVIR